MNTDRRFSLLLVCFFVSGLAALVYETAWTRQFTFVLGTSELAVATVLAAYMAGLAAGAALAARWAPRIRHPILVYALLELGIGVAALAVPAAIDLSRDLYVVVFGGAGQLADQGGLARVLYYLACSFVILMIPTGLMGATLPLLARHAVRSDEQVGPRVGFLYTANTLGAVCGTVLTAFALLPNLGLRGSIWVAIGANFFVFGAGVLLARHAPPVTFAAGAGAPSPVRRLFGRSELILPIMLLSGAASFTYEVLWTRLLGFLLGGSVYAFATMLGTFLTGIALGAWFGSRIAKVRTRAARAFGWAQIGTAVLSVLAFYAMDWMPTLARTVEGVSQNVLFADTAVAIATLLPSTLCIGATFPLAVRLLAPNEASVTAASARVFAWNTTGAIVGAIGAGFFLVPSLGFAGTLSLAVAINLGLAVIAGALLSELRPRAVWVAAAGLVVLAILRPSPPWNLLRSSPLRGSSAQGPFVFHAVGRAATVDVVKQGGAFHVRTNGLPEALVLPPGARQGQLHLGNWLAALPSLTRPQAKRMMVVGLGGGTIHEAVPSSVQRIDTVEIEVMVIEANRAIADDRRHDPLSEPRVHLIINDARDALTLSGGRYDAIVSQPSHPWTAAASHLYTREFFELARERLATDGVFAQWMSFRFVDEALLRTLVATLVEVFPFVRVYQPGPQGVIFLASARSLDVEASAPRALAAHPEEYARLGIFCLEDLAAALVLDEAGARAFSAGAAVNTDNRNRLAMRSPGISRAKRHQARRSFDEILSEFDPLRGPTPCLDRCYLVWRLAAFGATERAARLAESIRDPAVRDLLKARVAMASDNLIGAANYLNKAVDRQPDLRAAWITRLKLDYLRGQLGAAPDAGQLRGLRDSDRAVIETWWYELSGDWAAVRRVEPRLASLNPRDPLFADALRLRAKWRIAEGDPALAAEALDLVDMVLVTFGTLPDMVLRARAVASAGLRPGLVMTLHQILAWPGFHGRRRIAEEVLAIIDDVMEREARDDPELADLRRQLQEILELS